MDLSAVDQYWIWLSSVEGIGPLRFYQLIGAYGDPRSVWDNVGDDGMKFLGSATLRKLREARDERYFYELFNRLEKLNMRALTRENAAYPQRLLNIYDPPPVLYTLGECDLNSERCFAIVGSRRCTRDGQRAAREVQRRRYANDPAGIRINAQLSARNLNAACRADDDARELLLLSCERLNLSNRAYTRILKVARTIADLEGAEVISAEHVSEAVQYRTLDRKYWG